ncbi:MAG: hypothetical protein IIT38_06330, partial [Bacteroidales bacterium]|nr:hypothetical protein [Bacteroidales bacterium]
CFAFLAALFEWLTSFLADAVSMAKAVSELRVSRYAVRMADAVSRWRTEGQSSILAVSLRAC